MKLFPAKISEGATLTTPEIPEHTIMLSVCHPQILRKHCLQFLLGPAFVNSQEKLKTMLMQNFGATNKEHYGMLWYFLERSIAKSLTSEGNSVPEHFDRLRG